MGQAEQRQVQTGVAERVRQETDATYRQAGMLGEIARHRREADDHERHLAGAKRGIRAAIAMTILGDDPPPDVRIAAVARWTVEEVEALRADLARHPDA